MGAPNHHGLAENWHSPERTLCVMALARSSVKASRRRGVGGVAALAVVAALGLFSNLGAGQSAKQPPAAAGRESKPLKSTGPQAGQPTFPSAEQASHALVTALQTGDPQAIVKVLGRDAKDVVSSGDETEDANDRDQFVHKYQQMHRLVTEPDGTTTLYIGAENWPTPIPLVHNGNAWYFDTEAGKREILYRRIGENELTAIQVCRELVDAEKEYYAQPHDGDSGRQYAQRFFSDPGRHNGLYWKASSDEAVSPIGALVASAADEGYTEAADQKPQPFQAYYFQSLKGQGAKAPGGSESYLVDGKMTRGFAFVAYPAEYRSSGVMTFIVNQDGIVYERDLGPRTAEIAKALKRYDRDASWHKAD